MAENYIKDVLKDVLKHTHNLGIFEAARISGTTGETSLDSIGGERTVVLNGKLHNPVPDFADHVLGFSRMGVLQGYVQYPGFDAEDSTVKTVFKDRNGENVPEEILFQDSVGNKANYRLLSQSIIDSLLGDIAFKGAEFDLDVVPTSKNIKDLSYFNGVMGSYEPNFIPATEDGALYFHIGHEGSDRTKIMVSNNVDGEIKTENSWPLDIVLKIMRLGESGTCVMSINSAGLLRIVVDSGLGEYTYYLLSGS